MITLKILEFTLVFFFLRVVFNKFNIIFYFCYLKSTFWSVFLTAIWLSLEQLWAILEGTASLTWCSSMHLYNFKPRVPRSLIMWWVPKPGWVCSGVWMGNPPILITMLNPLGPHKYPFGSHICHIRMSHLWNWEQLPRWHFKIIFLFNKFLSAVNGSKINTLHQINVRQHSCGWDSFVNTVCLSWSTDRRKLYWSWNDYMEFDPRSESTPLTLSLFWTSVWVLIIWADKSEEI